MLETEIIYFGKKVTVQCDQKCNKAWGINCRPKIQLSDDYDDYVYLADDELGDAPIYPGTYEGGCGKPREFPDKHNKWCVRECERSSFDNDAVQDFSVRVYNQPRKHT